MTALSSPHAVKLTQNDEDLTQNSEALRHLCDTSLSGTEGHLHGGNKGTPALHHNDTGTHREQHHQATQEVRNVAKLEIIFKSFLLLLSKLPFDNRQKLINWRFQSVGNKRLLGVYFSILQVEVKVSPTDSHKNDELGKSKF